MITRVTKSRGNISWHAYQCSTHPDGEYPGATTMIGKKAKGYQFEDWLKRQGALAACRAVEALPAMLETSTEDAVVKMLAASADKLRDTAGARGTAIHAGIEHFFHKERIADCTRHEPPCSPDIEGIKPALAGFWRWVQEARPTEIATEFMVIDHGHRYAATGDLRCRIGDDRWLIDAKSSKWLSTDTCLQLAAIEWAEHGEDDQPTPKADRFGVLHVRDDGTELVEYPVTRERDFRDFLHCADMYYADKERKRLLRGRAL